jgi:uncharacterized membrane protein YdjX (TVP38/TMEM64 family)
MSSVPLPQPGNPTTAGKKLQFAALAIVLALGFLLAYKLGVFSPHFRDELQRFLRALGPWAIPVFIAIKVVTVVLALPSAPVTFTGGVLFGPVWGTLINVFAATTGASCTFFIGRKIGRETVEHRLHGRLQELDEGLAENGLSFMLFLRLVPLFPVNAINYGSGLTRVSFRDYFLGTVLGIIPGAAVFTYLGSAAAEGSTLKFAIGFALLGVLALIPIFVKWRKNAAKNTPKEE